MTSKVEILTRFSAVQVQLQKLIVGSEKDGNYVFTKEQLGELTKLTAEAAILMVPLIEEKE